MMSSASRLYRVLKVINIDENQVSLSISLVLGEIKGIVSTSAWSKFHNFPCKLKLNEFKNHYSHLQSCFSCSCKSAAITDHKKKL